MFGWSDKCLDVNFVWFDKVDLIVFGVWFEFKEFVFGEVFL